MPIGTSTYIVDCFLETLQTIPVGSIVSATSLVFIPKMGWSRWRCLDSGDCLQLQIGLQGHERYWQFDCTLLLGAGIAGPVH